MPSGLKPDDRGFCRIRRLLGSCLDEPGRFSDPDWKVGSAWEKGRLEKSSAGGHLSPSSLMQYRKPDSTWNKLLKCLLGSSSLPTPLSFQCLLVINFSEQRDRPSTGECRGKEPLGNSVLEKAHDRTGATALTHIQNAPVVLPRKF